MIPIENECEIMSKIYLWLIQYSPLGQRRILEWVSNRLQDYEQEKTWGKPGMQEVKNENITYFKES